MTYKQIFEQAHKDGYWWAEWALNECSEILDEEFDGTLIDLANSFEWKEFNHWCQIYFELGEERKQLQNIESLERGAQLYLDTLTEKGVLETSRLLSYMVLEESSVQIVSLPLRPHEKEISYFTNVKSLVSPEAIKHALKNARN